MDKETLTELLGFSEIIVTGVELKKTEILLHCESNLRDKLCPICLEKCNVINNTYVRIIRDLSILGKEVYLHLKTRQFVCKTCDRYFHERFDFVDSNSQMTKRLEHYLYLCCQSSSIKEVSIRENILWDVLQGIFDKCSRPTLGYLASKIPKRIGIDEIAYRKGKKDYATVITDLDTSEVIDVLDFRTKEELIAYFKEKGELFCKSVEVFSCDMFEGFSSTAKAVFPQADIVIDRFHFFAHLNKVLDEERKSLRKKYPDEVRFKEIKWLLYKHWKDLSNSQRYSLLKAFRLAPTLRELYFFKIELVNILEKPS